MSRIDELGRDPEAIWFTDGSIELPWPFSAFRHHHGFLATDGGTMLVDDVRSALIVPFVFALLRLSFGRAYRRRFGALQGVLPTSGAAELRSCHVTACRARCSPGVRDADVRCSVSSPVTQPTIVELDRRTRRRLVWRATLRVALTTVGLFGLYAIAPTPEQSGAAAAVGLAAGLVFFGVLLAWQIRAIIDADYPGLRAAEALAVAVPVLIIVFAYTYLSVSRARPDSFSEHLDRIDALYFTVTTLGTVGFGDITATTGPTRLIVTGQIALDFVLVAVLARIVVAAVQYGRQRRDTAPTNDS